MVALAWIAVTLTGCILLKLVSPASAETFGPCPECRRTERHYTLSAKVRPLLFWIRRDDVGDGRITWTNEAGGVKGLELLIGSDPARVPMRINRWGYIGEFHQHSAVDVIGMMTQSDEGTAEEARLQSERRGDGDIPYRAIQTRIEDGVSSTRIFHKRLPHTITYRAINDAREMMGGGTGRPRIVPVPDNADEGFLNAVALLVREGVESYRKRGVPAQRADRWFIYASRIYKITIQSSKTHPKFLFGGAVHTVLESDFAVLNQETGKATKFRILYGTSHPIAETPVRIVFRPHWWLEAELNLRAWSVEEAPN